MVAEIALVFGERGRIEEAQALIGLSELLLDEIVGIGTHQPLGKIVRLDHEKPMPRESAPLPRHVVEQMMLGNDVENGGTRDLFRMIEAHAVEHAGAAIMAGGIEALEPERGHHLELVLPHGAERIAPMVRPSSPRFRTSIS